MSRIGKQPIVIPNGVDVTINGSSVSVKGSKGELKREFSRDVTITKDNNQVVIEPKHSNASAVWGLTRALLANMIKGVSDGFEENLEFNGIGFKANLKGNDLELNLGFSHPISVPAPQGITFKVEKNKIAITGIDKELIGQVAATIRKYRKPEPYKGTGIFYKGETITRKAGKKAATTA